jgi:hypothetical protein
MGINKNFVVRHGFEASTDLILADADTRKVGIGTTIPERELQVAGGIGATDFYLTGIGTFVDELNVGLGGTVLTVLGLGNSIGIGTALPEYLLDIRSPVSTGQTALYVQGDVRITGDIQADDIIFDDAEIQDLTVTDTLFVVGLSTFNSNVFVDADLNISGITTLGNYVDINSSVDIADDLNVVGLTTLSGYVDINNSLDVAVDLNVGGLTTLGGYVEINDSVDISNDLNVSGIATIANISVVGAALSNLIVPGITILGVTSISQLNVSGIGTITNLIGTAGTITTLNSTTANLTNISGTNLNYSGIGTITTLVVGTQVNKANISYLTNTARTFTIPSVDGNRTFAFIDQDQTFNGTQTFSNLNATGITTLGIVRVSSGIVTATSGIVTYYGDGAYLNLTNNPIKGVGIRTEGGIVGYGVTLVDFRGTGVSTTFYNSNVGIATIFFEGGGTGGATTPGGSDGQVQYNSSNTFAGSSNFTFDGTSVVIGLGVTLNSSGINVTGVVTATDFNSLSDINYKENIYTVENALLKVEKLRGVSFDWKETGKPSYGIIAQELEEILPELVSDGEIKTVNYNGIIGVLIEAIKELKEEIEKFKI